MTLKIFYFSILICLTLFCDRNGIDQNYGFASEDIAFVKQYSDLVENPFVKVENQIISIVPTNVEGASYSDVRQYYYPWVFCKITDRVLGKTYCEEIEVAAE